MARLTETVKQDPDLANRIDEAAGIIKGVKLLGEVSKNGRRYKPKAMKEAVELYEGRKSYVDHPSRDEMGSDRSFKDWCGVYRGAYYKEGHGIFADLHLRQSSEYFDGIIESARKFPNEVGFSHVAEGESHYDGETEIIESIKEVFSVDLVTDPATTAGFFESVERKTFREVIEEFPEEHETLRTKLLEMMDTGYMDAGFGNAKEPPTDALSQLTAVLRDTIGALADSLKALAKANKPAPAPVAAAPGAAPGTPPTDPATEESDAPEEEDEEMTDEDKQKIAAFESLQRENAELQASKLLLESGRVASTVRIKALANCETEAERDELLESWPKIDDGRPARSPALVESASDFPRDNPEKFAALLR